MEKLEAPVRKDSLTPSASGVIVDCLDVWTSAVKRKSSAGRGRGSKRELYGIRKLRALILELAVRGMLVPQDPCDEPACELAKKIHIEKARLVKEGKIKKTRPLAPIDDGEKPFELPQGWEWVRLGEVTNYGSCEKVEADDVATDTWILELQDVEKISSKLLAKVRFKDRQFKSSKNVFSAGDVIYGKLRPYLDKVLVAGEDGVCTTEMIPIRGFACLVPAFLRLAMKSPNFVNYANESTHGMNLPRMGTAKARLALIPLLPVNEQQRIVAKVDELMTLCDQLEQQTESSLAAHGILVESLLGALINAADHAEFSVAWERIAQHFDTLFTTEHSIEELKQAILQLAVQGKIVPQDSNGLLAKELLKKINAERSILVKQRKIRKQKNLPSISDEEKPFEIPLDWEWVRLCELANEIGTGPFGSMIHKSDYIVGGVPLINPSHMIDDRIVEDPAISVEKIKADELASYRVSAGDILLARRGEVGRCAIVTSREEGWLCGTGSFYLRLSGNVSREYLALVFKVGSTRRFLAAKAVGTTMVNLNHGILNSLPVPLPPLKEQMRIIARVNKLILLCDRLKAQLEKGQAIQLHLAHAVSEQAVSQ